MSEKFVQIILPRVDDQPDMYLKLLAKFQRDSGNPWNAKISYDHINEDVKRALSIFKSRNETNFKKPRSKFFEEMPIKKFLKPFVEGSERIFEVTNDKMTSGRFPFSFRKYIRHETEKVLCEMAYKMTGIDVKSLEELHQKVNNTYVFGIPYSKLGITSRNLFVYAPFIKFVKKKELERTIKISLLDA